MKTCFTFLSIVMAALLLCGCAGASVQDGNVPASSSNAAVSTVSPTVTATLAPELPAKAAYAAPASTPTPVIDDGTFTVVWMTDTQGLARAHLDIYSSMTDWILRNRNAFDIRCVLHTGDLIQYYNDDNSWVTADTALSPLDGELPFIMLAGNHDVTYGGKIRYDRYLELFGSDRYTLGLTSSHEKGLGRYSVFTWGGEDFLVLALGYGCEPEIYNWANYVLSKYPDHYAIVMSHGFLDTKGNLYGYGERMERLVVRDNPNVKLVLCGHNHGVAKTELHYDDNEDGTAERTVYAVMMNYQGKPDHGSGYMSLLKFDIPRRTLDFSAYSPWLDDYSYYDDESKENFTLPLDFD